MPILPIFAESENIQKTTEDDYEALPREWQTSGPFQIDRSEYALGEKIFLRIGELKFDEKGQVTFMRPLNSTHYSVYLTVPFDGAKKEMFNYYIDPQLSKTRGLCSVDDVLGKWAVVFRGTDYPTLYFEIVDKTVPGTSWDPVCFEKEDSQNPMNSQIEIQNSSDGNSQKIPEWVRNIFIWYAEEKVSEDELLNAIKYLIQQEIILLDS